ncbi:MAG: hypothetical protein AB3N16_01330, partial [Flavobacteriaceae bacterium]
MYITGATGDDVNQYTIDIDRDGDGTINSLDLDSDGDGIPDNVEAQPTASYTAPSGGGAAMTDDDNDGLDDNYDSNTGSTDPTASAGITPENTDGNGFADYLDDNSDDDLYLDKHESGISVVTDATYDDVNGSVDNPSTTLTDTNPITPDVDYRDDKFDLDGDGIVNSDDIDDDNDGILDINESTFATQPNVLAYTMANFSGDSQNGSIEIFNNDSEKVAVFTWSSPNPEVTAPSTINGPDGGTNNVVTAGIAPFSGSQYGWDFTLENLSDEPLLVSMEDLNNHGPSWTNHAGTWTVTFDTYIKTATIIDVSAQGGGAAVTNVTTTANPTASLSSGDSYNVTASASTGNIITILQFGIALPAETTSVFSIFRTGSANENFAFRMADSTPLINGTDMDGDGESNSTDLDSDNDGISDLYESGTTPTIIAADTNADGTISLAEAEAVLGVGNADADGDGLWDFFDDDITDTDPTLSVGTDPVDTDTDGVDDYNDLDADGDGIPDTVEARPTAGYVANDGNVTSNDADKDGIIAMFDTNDATTGIFGGTHANLNAPEDTDGDNTPDYLDTDSDNDSVLDTYESGLPSSGTDTDEDGIDDALNAFYTDPDGDINNPQTSLANEVGDTSEVGYREYVDSDGDGVADKADLDDDNDGILDTDEGLVCTYNAVENGGFDTAPTNVEGWYSGSAPYDLTTNAVSWQTSRQINLTGGLFEDTGDSNDAAGGGVNIAINSGAYFYDFGVLALGNHSFSFDVQGNSGNMITNPLLVEVWDATTDTQVAELFNQTLNGFADAGNPQTVSGSFNITDSTHEYRLVFHSLGNGSSNYDYHIDRVAVNPSVCLTVDTDGDTVPDHLDLNSDDDSCPDAIEGGGSFTSSDLADAGTDDS